MRALEILAAIGLILPPALGIFPVLAPRPRRGDLLSFTTGLIELRRRHPVFRRRRFLTGRAAADLRWFTASDTEMTDQNWADPMGLIAGLDELDRPAPRNISANIACTIHKARFIFVYLSLMGELGMGPAALDKVQWQGVEAANDVVHHQLWRAVELDAVHMPNQ